jgi:hypothetical protein
LRIRAVLVSLAVAAASLPAVLQTGSAAAAADEPEHGQRGGATAHARINLSDEARREARAPKRATSPRGGIEEGRPLRYLNGASSTQEDEPQSPAMGPAAVEPSAPSPATDADFQGIGDNNTAVPPDTFGAVGPGHLVTALNTEVRIQSRSGTNLQTLSLDGFWSSVLPSGTFAFDPKILYDPYTGHWIFVACAGVQSAKSAVLIAASQTSDPTGSWSLFAVDADAANTLWADYPSFGFNKNWIVVQVNMFALSGPGGESRIFAFDKTADLYDNVDAPHTVFHDAAGFAQAPAVTYSTTEETEYLVEDWSGRDPSHGYQGTLRIRPITADATGDPVLGSSTYAVTAATWQDIGPNGFGAPQSGSAQKIDVGDARMQNCVFRNASLWCTHTVLLPATGTPTHSAVQWWKIGTSPLGTVQQRGRIEDTTGAKWFAYPSIAVNAGNDALLGYSRFAANQFASANYAFRSADDLPNTFRDDSVLKAGEAKYHKTLGGTENRWGDYSSTVVDPANDSDFWTVQEYAAAPSGGIDRWGTWWGKIDGVIFTLPGTLTGSVNAAFVNAAKNVTISDFVLRLGGSTANMGGTLACKDAAGAAVDCAAGPVKTAALQPSARLVPGQHYTVSVNPGGSPDQVLHWAGGDALAPKAESFRASLSEQESSTAARFLWRTISNSAAYGGSYVAEHTTGAHAHFRFTLPAPATVSWYTITGPGMGLADVYIDSVKKGTYNQYASSTHYKIRRSFSLPAGSHVFSIVALGKKGSTAASDSLVAVDAFQTGSTFLSSPALTYTWRIAATSAASAGAYATTSEGGSNVYFAFRGTGIDWYTVTGPSQGKATVYIDGINKGTIDNYASTAHYGVRRSYRGLSDTVHTIRIVVAGAKNAAASGTWIAVDRWGIV